MITEEKIDILKLKVIVIDELKINTLKVNLNDMIVTEKQLNKQPKNNKKR